MKNSSIEPLDYGPAVLELMHGDGAGELGRGAPNAAARVALERLTPARLVAPRALGSDDFARGCIAGLWLRHGFLDESHTISQSLDNSSGSYWHGLMHRREGDFDNTKYWFRRVG